jgi:hypothetical protein
VRGELGVDAEPHLLRLVLGLRDDAVGLGLRRPAAILDLFAGRLEQSVALHRRVADEHARLLFRDAQHLFELVTVGRVGGGGRELIRQRLHLGLGVREARVRGGEFGLELLRLVGAVRAGRRGLGLQPLDLSAQALNFLAMAGLHPGELRLELGPRLGGEPLDLTAALRTSRLDLGLEPFGLRPALRDRGAGAPLMLLELRDLVVRGAHARVQPGDRRVDLFSVVAAEHRGEAGVRGRDGGVADEAVERAGVIRRVVFGWGVVGHRVSDSW